MAIWSTVGTWGNAVAMAVAAFFAWKAWRSDRQKGAVARVDAFLITLTTGSVASARDRLTAWTKAHCGEVPPANYRIGSPQNPLREHAVTSDAEKDLRHGVFEILWVLQRSSLLIDDLRMTNRASRDAVIYHLSLIVESLNDFSAELSEGEINAFKESAVVAQRALTDVKTEFPNVKTLSSDSSDEAAWNHSIPEMTAKEVVEFRFNV